jgi:LysR family cys regulon transcriptional activator
VNLHQFRFIQEAVRRNLNLTETAKALHTSQPGVSKAILELEEELGIDIFVRHGKRLRRVTEPGEQVLKSIELIMREVGNLKRIGDQYSKQEAGTLSIATTHTQARYFLPSPVALLRRRYPQVQVELHQGTPEQVASMLLDESADIGLATEALQHHEGLISLPCYEWQHCIVVPRGHPLASVERPTLEQLAVEPLVTYHPTVTGRSRIDAAFLRARLKPEIALEALDYIHRVYQSEESIKILGELVSVKLFNSLVVMQVALGMLLPMLILAVVRSRRVNDDMRRILYFLSALLIQLGIFSMRWNVVIGGQLYSKSFRGLMAYKMELTGLESLMTALLLLALPFVILTVLSVLLPTRWLERRRAGATAVAAH